ncbi:FAD synthase [Dorcoceras hygrometricum]|uniref:FAD synthase n=1 Tax=Dorcoceras hygrometricum TaxID=472368 RepID=A0A2Z7AX31_9LAMI|nr:FAD synthase [Dorcoceras hygrometricum]
MEIVEAMREIDDRRLKTKYSNAIYVIQRALALYSYKLHMDIIRQDFKSGLEALLKAKPIRAIFLGVRIGDPTAIDSVADEVERWKSTNDMVFIYGGFGPLLSDVTVAGVAKAFGVRMAPDEEFEEYLRHLIGESCTGDRNEMAQLPEGITELVHHEKLKVPLVKCQNVIILTATNVVELDSEWDCLMELMTSSGLSITEKFWSKKLATALPDVEISQPLSKLCMEFPDLYIGKKHLLPSQRPLQHYVPDIFSDFLGHEGAYRQSRAGPLIITFEGKDEARIKAAAEALRAKFEPAVLSEMA